MLRKLALKKKSLNKSNLKDLNNFAHLGNFSKKLKTFKSDYENLERFIDDFEKYLETQIETPSLKLSTQDRIFEGIVNRLDILSDFKKIVIRIYLESQKNPKGLEAIIKRKTGQPINILLRLLPLGPDRVGREYVYPDFLCLV